LISTTPIASKYKLFNWGSMEKKRIKNSDSENKASRRNKVNRKKDLSCIHL
jgi:hypothetical protein